MKIEEIKADSTAASLLLVPENPAEVALINLFAGCEANCTMSASTDNQPEEKLRIYVTVKKSRY